MSSNSIVEQNALAGAVAHEVLTLHLGAETYGIGLLAVQEIRRFEAPTRIADAPADLLGVTNLRGVIVPVVDLRRRLGLDGGFGPATVTVVVNVGGRTFGLVVDAVSDVVALAPEQVKPAPPLGHRFAADHLVGLGTIRQGDQDRLLILLDIARLLADL